jgi:hypothetical protein
MFNWVCPRCGHDVPPSKTECPYCTPPAPEPPPAQQPKAPQYQAPAYQAPPQQPPQQQYWQPQQPYQPGPPPQYPQGPPPPQQPYSQQAPQQYWQPPTQYPPAPPQYPQAPPQQYPPQQYQPQQQEPGGPPQYPPPPYQPAQQYQPEEARQQYAAPPAAQYAPPAAPVVRQPEAPTPWPPPEQRTGRPAWQLGLLAFIGVLAIFGIAYYLMGSHGSSAAKDAAKQQTTNPLQKYLEVVGIRLATDKAGAQAVKFLVVNHSGNEMTDLAANVTLWASTQRSEEDSAGSFTFHIASLAPGESKELTAPLKTDKPAYDQPDWQNITADVQVTSPQQ